MCMSASQVYGGHFPTTLPGSRAVNMTRVEHACEQEYQDMVRRNLQS